jgi:hypothetical protein
MITSFDVESGREIGSGGLWVFLCLGVTGYHLSSHSLRWTAHAWLKRPGKRCELQWRSWSRMLASRPTQKYVWTVCFFNGLPF